MYIPTFINPSSDPLMTHPPGLVTLTKDTRRTINLLSLTPAGAFRVLIDPNPSNLSLLLEHSSEALLGSCVDGGLTPLDQTRRLRSSGPGAVWVIPKDDPDLGLTHVRCPFADTRPDIQTSPLKMKLNFKLGRLMFSFVKLRSELQEVPHQANSKN